MNRLLLLLIIINNASLPIYLSHAPTNHFYWSSQPPLLHTAHPPSHTHTRTCTHIHAHHTLTHTNPHFSHTNTFFNCSFPPSPILSPSSLSSNFLSLPHPLAPQSPTPPACIPSSPSFTPALVSNPIWLLQQHLRRLVHEEWKAARISSAVQSCRKRWLKKKKKGHPVWDPFNELRWWWAGSSFGITQSNLRMGYGFSCWPDPRAASEGCPMFSARH